MKKIRILALAVALLMLSACVVGCTKVEKVTVNAVVTVVDGEENILGPVNVAVESTADVPVTVLMALTTALDNNEIVYTCTEDQLSISSIADRGDKNEDGMEYFWEYTINGEEVETGRAGTNTFEEGAQIVFTYVSESTEDLAKADEEGDE